MTGLPIPNYLHASSETSYPSGGTGPWNGQPIVTAPASDFYTPGESPVAQEDNYRLKAITDFQTALLGWTGQIVAQNWVNGPYAVGGTSSVMQAVCWDKKNSRWLVAVKTSGAAIQVWAFNGGGAIGGGYQVGANLSATQDVLAMAANPTTGRIVVIQRYSGFNGIREYYDTSADAWTSTATPAMPLIDSGTLDYLPSAGKFVLFGGKLAAGTQSKVAAYSTDGVSWTDASSAVSSDFTFVNSTGTSLLARSCQGTVSGTPVLMCMIEGGTGIAKMAYTANGTSWTTITTNLTAGQLLKQVAYDATNLIWLATTNDETSTGKIIRASAGAINTWSDVTSFSGIIPSGIACMGQLWLLTMAGVDLRWVSDRGLVSVDKGATWRWTGHALPADGAGISAKSAGIHDKVFTNGAGFMSVNAKNVAFSQLVGLPDAVTYP